MGVSINSDISTMTARRYLSKADRQVDKSLKALASGSRVVSASDDAAGFAISERLRGQLSGTKQAKFNAQSAMALVQTAEGGLNEQNNILIRLRELAVNSASDSIGDEEREFVDQEFQQLKAEFDRIAQSTRFGNQNLLTGTQEQFSFHVGPYAGDENVVEFTLDANTTASSVGVDSLGVADQGDSLDAIESLDEAVLEVAGARSTLGAVQSRFRHVIDNLDVQKESLSSARSLITDVDVAEEVSKLTQGQVLQDAGISIISQANNSASKVLRLLG